MKEMQAMQKEKFVLILKSFFLLFYAVYDGENIKSICCKNARKFLFLL